MHHYPSLCVYGMQKLEEAGLTQFNRIGNVLNSQLGAANTGELGAGSCSCVFLACGARTHTHTSHLLTCLVSCSLPPIAVGLRNGLLGLRRQLAQAATITSAVAPAAVA